LSKNKARTGGGALRIHQSVARKIGTAILSGEYDPGQPFGGEIERSAEMGVSRTAYREAMRILVAKGLLESRPKAGTRVTPRKQWNLLDPDILGWMFSSRPDERFVRDLFELRHLIEPTAAAMAAERRNEDHIRRLEEAIDGMRTHGLATPEGQAADRDFHHVLLEATGNSLLVTLSSSIGAAVQWTTYFKQHIQPTPRDPLPDHEKLCAAIVAGDAPRAREAMAELLRLAFQDMNPQ
jgi:DNA-binding FadR family transcriptional regulator